MRCCHGSREFLVLIVLLGSLARAEAQTQEDSDFAFGVKQLGKHFDTPARLRFRSRELATGVSGEGAAQKTQTDRYDVLFFKDGNNVDVRKSAYIAIDVDDQHVDKESRSADMTSQALAANDSFFAYQVEFLGGHPTSHTVSQLGTHSEAEDGAYHTLAVGEIVFGYLPADSNIKIPDLFAKGTNRHARRLSDPRSDHSMLVLDCDVATGHHVIWLDADVGYVPRRIEVVKFPANALPIPGTEIYEFVADEFVYSTGPSATRIPMSFHIADSLTIRGVKSRTSRRLTIQEFTTNPDFSQDLNAFKLSAPEGTRVFRRIQTAIQYEWRDGKVTPLIDRRIAGVIDDSIKPIPPFPRSYPVSFAIIAVLIAVGISVGTATFMFIRKRSRR